MKTLTFTVNAYEYNELSQNAKNKVRELIYEMEDGYIFNEELENAIEEKFPQSILKYSYSLNNCQGDGLYVYGKLDCNDLYTTIMDNIDNMTDKEIKRIKFYLNELCENGYDIDLPMNYYNYNYCTFNDVYNAIQDTFDTALNWNSNYKNIDMGLIRKVSGIAAHEIEEFCNEWEKRGYNYFEWAFNASDDEISELCDANEWLFDESGALL